MRIGLKTTKEQVLNKLTKHLKKKTTLQQLLQWFPEILAKRIMKDALMNASKNLYELGFMTDHNIRVRVKTTAWKGETNLLMYEIGNMLYIIGAQGDKGKGWVYQFFQPEK